MPSTIALRLIGFFVLLPSTLGAGFWTLQGIGYVVDAWSRATGTSFAFTLAIAMALGWFGLTTLWSLYYSLLRGDLSFNRRAAWAGLVSGSLVSVALIVASGGTVVFRLCFFGWPLLASTYFSIVLRRLP